MYQIGDLVFYSNMGVYRITDISMQSFQGATESQLYYTLKPLHQQCVINTLVGNDKVFMRPVISREEAERLIDMIPAIQAEPYHSKVISKLAEHYMQSLKTHNCADLIELTMSIYEKKKEVEGQKRKFGTIDEKYMKLAEKLLFDELSVALGIAWDEVPTYIESRVNVLKGKQEKHPNGYDS